MKANCMRGQTEMGWECKLDMELRACIHIECHLPEAWSQQPNVQATLGRQLLPLVRKPEKNLQRARSKIERSALFESCLP